MWTQTQSRTLVESKHTLTAGGRHPPREEDQGCERERPEDGGGKPGTEACVRGCRHPPSWEQSPRLTAPDTALTAARCSDLLRGGRRRLHASHSHRLSTSQPGVRGPYVHHFGKRSQVTVTRPQIRTPLGRARARL